MFEIRPKNENKVKAIKLLGIYNKYRRQAIDAGFTYNEFWLKVNFYMTDIFQSDAADWALAGQLAYEDLIAEREIALQPETINDYIF
tara:strand:- start:345 stop:605 length:261 start_codon:yes stop_codon:yes gene_type:complete